MGYKLREEHIKDRASSLVTIRRSEYEKLLEGKKELSRMMDVETENELLNANMEALLFAENLEHLSFVDGMVVNNNKAKTSKGKSEEARLSNKFMEKVAALFFKKA